jgi:hypothetical protein
MQDDIASAPSVPPPAPPSESTLSPQVSAKRGSGTGGLKPMTSGLRPLGPPGPRVATQATAAAFHAQKSAADAQMQARNINSGDPTIGGVTAGERMRRLAEINYDHQSRMVAKEAMSDHIDLSGITDDGMTMDEYDGCHHQPSPTLTNPHQPSPPAAHRVPLTARRSPLAALP